MYEAIQDPANFPDLFQSLNRDKGHLDLTSASPSMDTLMFQSPTRDVSRLDPSLPSHQIGLRSVSIPYSGCKSFRRISFYSGHIPVSREALARGSPYLAVLCVDGSQIQTLIHDMMACSLAS